MNLLETALRSVACDLNEIGCKYALVGGFAVSARAEPRFTRDIDLAIAVNDDNEAERTVNMLGQHGYAPVFISEQESVGRLATVRLAVRAADGVVVDLLFASSGSYPRGCR